MTRFIAIVAIVLIAGVAHPALAQMPKLLEVGEDVPAELRDDLRCRRADLVEERSTLQARAKANKERCTGVVPGSDLAEDCADEKRKLEDDRLVHVEAAKAFNRAVERERRIAELEAEIPKIRAKLAAFHDALPGLAAQTEEWCDLAEEARTECRTKAIDALVTSLRGMDSQAFSRRSRPSPA